MSTKQCPECGTDNPSGAKYCIECGADIRNIRQAENYPEPDFTPLANLGELRFKYPWRTYQQRVLEAINAHLEDDKIHIVAAPGSGKTTLGIEISRRLGRRVLVLSPTRTIRNQWIDRLKHFTNKETAVWTSTDLDRLSDFNSITYQAVHTRYKQESNEIELDTTEAITNPLDDAPTKVEIDKLVDHIHKHHIGTVILDEAHHLRSEWWKALTRVLELLPYIKMVSLTATPPYDVSGHEWKKYHALCGPIDEEIAVPELVRSGTLAPHQDFVWSVFPFKNEEEYIKQYTQDVEQVCDALFTSEAFLKAVKMHPWVARHQLEIDALLNNYDVLVSILVYLKAKGEPLPEQLMLIIDADPEDIPELTRERWQTLLKAFLFDAGWQIDESGEQYRKELKRDLRARHLLWRREIRLTQSRLMKSKLTLSSAKIKACVDIYQAERAIRGDSLRQVILTDFIRDEYEPGSSDPVLGVWPVYSTLLAEIGERPDMAMISGRLSIIHRDRLPALQHAYGEKILATSPVQGFANHIQIAEPGSNIVAAFTQIFMSGDLHVLVGTRSLLGEGWDAPCINSLVLASFVGSFMLTNQMRGRAIRVDKDDPGKVASIWHIVAIARHYWAGLIDLVELDERFNTFVGLSEREPAILNGLSRLALPYLDRHGNFQSSKAKLVESNKSMKKRLGQLREIADRWRKAIIKGEKQIVVPTLSVPKPLSVSPLHLTNTLAWFVAQALAVFFSALTYGASSLGQSSGDGDWRTLLVVLAIVLVVSVLYASVKLFKALRLWLLHLPIDGTIRQIGMALRDALIETRQLDGPATRMPVLSREVYDGSVYAWLGGGSFQEQSIFSDALEEILSPVENPRYIVMRYKKRKFSILQSVDYHAVPQLLGVKKSFAETFAKHWARRVGPTKLLYMRGQEGRRLLLTLRGKAFSNAAEGKTKRVDRWS
jgi:superfamily II DNA or RNA helicase